MSVTHLKPQCLPLVCGIKSFKAHHELAVPPSSVTTSQEPSPSLRVSSHSDLLIARHVMGTPHPQHLNVPSFPQAGTLLANACLTVTSLSSLLKCHVLRDPSPQHSLSARYPQAHAPSPYYFIFFIALITT